MGVMEKLRASTKYILWILILSFGVLWMLSDTKFFDALVYGPRSLGSVNGDAISLDEYNRQVQYYTQRYSQQTGRNITPEVRANYEEQVWNDLVNSRLISQKMDELGITVTDGEIVDMISGDNPDQMIVQFFTNEQGQFDRARLNQTINSPEASQQWIAIEGQLRQKRLNQKLNNYLMAANVVSSEEVADEYVKANSTASIEFVRFPLSDINANEITVSDSEISAYYNDNKDEFKREESYNFSFVTFSKAATKEDTARTQADVIEYGKLLATADNDSVFLHNYQSTTPYHGDFVELNDMREEFKVIKDLRDGEVSDVIRIGNSFHVLKRVAKKGNSYKFVDFSLAVEADAINTIDVMAERADDFSFYATDSSLEEEAESRGIEAKNSFATKGNQFVAGLGNSRQILNFLSVAEVGEVSKAFELDRMFVVVQLNEKKPAGFRPLDEVKDLITNKIKTEKRKELALKKVEAVSAADLEGYAKALDVKVDSAQTLLMSASVLPKAGREPKLIGQIFTLAEGTMTKPLVGETGVFVIKVNSMKKADKANLTEAQRTGIRQRLEQNKAQSFMFSWVQELKTDADIVDNRGTLLKNS